MMIDSSPALIWKRGLHRGLKTLFRQPRWRMTLATLCTLFLLMQMLLVSMIVTESLQSTLMSRTEVRIEVRSGASNQSVSQFFATLQQQPYVEDSAYITKEKAFERAREYDPELVRFIEEFGMANPFPDTIGVRLTSLEDYAQLRYFVEQDLWQEVVNPAFLSEVTDQELQIERLLNVANAAKGLVSVVLFIVGLSLFFVCIELVRRRILEREEEVLVEKLVGASPLSLFVPFLAEAIVLLFVGSLLSMALCVGLLSSLTTIVPALQSGSIIASIRSDLVPVLYQLLPAYFGIELLCIPVLAAAGTWLGMRPELKARTLNLKI